MRAIILAVLGMMATACSGGGTIGPCYVGYDEPLFTVASARAAGSGAPISSVVLRDFLYGRPPDARPGVSFLTDHFGLEPRNVTVSGNTLLCQIACAFGAAEGGYTLTFGAAGYRDTTFTVSDARFTRSRGGCPAFLSGGVVLNLRLTPQ